MAIGPSVYAKIPYDVVKDFAPIGLFITTPKLLASHPSLPVKSIRELVALAQARPNELNFGSSGTGSAPHLAVELLKLAANIEMVHVPYKGMGPATVDLIGGQLQLAFPDLPVLVQHVKAGKLRALAVGTPQRSALMPEVPTMAESGYPQVEAYNWYALFAPAATPKEITARLSTELAAIVNAPETKALMQAQGADASSSTQAELGTLLQEEIGKWAKVVKAAGIKVQ
jgi:tripartite-type tricarboxylate transporter receptor subunit TctC